MTHPLTLPPRIRSFRPSPALLVGAAVTLGSLGVGTTAYLGRGPTAVTVTDTSGGATFNFRVMGIPVPGKVQGVTPHLTFTPSDLAATRGTVAVNLAALDTGIALRDEHARRYLGVQQHPAALFTLTRLEGAKAIRAGQTLNATAVGTFALNGVAVLLRAPVTLVSSADGSAITVTSAFDVTFRAHHISIPGADPKTDLKVIFRLPTHA